MKRAVKKKIVSKAKPEKAKPERVVYGWHFTDGWKLRDGRKLEVGKTYDTWFSDVLVPIKGKIRGHKWVKRPTTKLELCKSGLHASRELGQAWKYVRGSVVSRVKCSGRIIHDKDSGDKFVCTKRKVLWAVDAQKPMQAAFRIIGSAILQGGAVDTNAANRILAGQLVRAAGVKWQDLDPMLRF